MDDGLYVLNVWHNPQDDGQYAFNTLIGPFESEAARDNFLGQQHDDDGNEWQPVQMTAKRAFTLTRREGWEQVSAEEYDEEYEH